MRKKRTAYNIRRGRQTEHVSRQGFTIAEVLISLMIMGLLLGAAAIALNASVMNYTTNEDIFRAMNTARQSLFRITNDLRTAKAVALIGINPGDDPDNQQCSMMTVNDDDITYRYDNNANILYLDVNAGVNAGNYILCEDVTAISFDRVTVVDDPFSIKNVQITLTVTVDGVVQTVSSAAVIRKNMIL